MTTQRTRWLLSCAMLAAPVLAAEGGPGVPADGMFRASSAPGLEEAYLPPVFASSHAANLLELKNGDLLCAWFSGTWEGNSDVAIMLARLPKGSSRWTRPQVVDRHPGESYQNPVLFEAPDRTLWIFHTTQPAGQGEAKAKVLVTQSKDGGVHWSAPAVLFDAPGMFIREPLVVMPNGNWLLPAYVMSSPGVVPEADTNHSVIEISADRGAHWRECPVPQSNGLVQPDVIRAGSGYLAFFRSRFADSIYRSTSRDGCAWTPPLKTELPNNNSAIQLAWLADGSLALAFDNVGSVLSEGRPKAGPRKPLSVALSKDNGETWVWVRDLETGLPAPEPRKDPNRKEPGREEYSYPSIIQTGDGRIYMAYTYRRYTIKVVRFDEKWIESGSTTGVFRPLRK